MRPGTTDSLWRPPTSTTNLPAPTDSAVEASHASALIAHDGFSTWLHRFSPLCGWLGAELTKTSLTHGRRDYWQAVDRTQP